MLSGMNYPIPLGLSDEEADAYRAAAEKNILRALNPKVYFGYFSVCADGKGHGGNTTFPGLDWGQSAEALLWLGRREEVLASWEFVKSFQREDGLIPFAILPDLAGKTTLFDQKYPLTATDRGAVFVHWVPGNPLRTLANVTFLLLADAIDAQRADPDWLGRQGASLRRAVEWLEGEITPEGLIQGGGFYVERPARLEFDGVNQCYSCHALERAAHLFERVNEPAMVSRCRQAADRLREAFARWFWAGDHCVEYIHPERGPISHHGLTDVDWAAVAMGMLSQDRMAVVWSQLRDHPDFVYSGIPTGISSRPETYEDWEMQGIDRHDLAAMGRVWFLECWARFRMGDAAGLRRSLGRVIAMGRAHDWSWHERYYSERTGDLSRYTMEYYCEYPATLIRVVNRFLRPTPEGSTDR